MKARTTKRVNMDIPITPQTNYDWCIKNIREEIVETLRNSSGILALIYAYEAIRQYEQE